MYCKYITYLQRNVILGSILMIWRKNVSTWCDIDFILFLDPFYWQILFRIRSWMNNYIHCVRWLYEWRLDNVEKYCAGLNLHSINTLRPRQNGRHFPDDILKCIFLNEKVSILIKISLKLIPKCSISNIPAFVQIMAWRRPGNKPLSEPMMVSFPT